MKRQIFNDNSDGDIDDNIDVLYMYSIIFLYYLRKLY